MIRACFLPSKCSLFVLRTFGMNFDYYLQTAFIIYSLKYKKFYEQRIQDPTCSHPYMINAGLFFFFYHATLLLLSDSTREGSGGFGFEVSSSNATSPSRVIRNQNQRLRAKEARPERSSQTGNKALKYGSALCISLQNDHPQLYLLSKSILII